jgi:hypothetical protein
MIKTIHFRVRQKKDSTENLGTRIKRFFYRTLIQENKYTHEMHSVNEDSMLAGYGGIKEFLRFYD